MSFSAAHKRPALINALLIALLLLGQAVYGWHDGESLDGRHTHSIECPVCLSERYAGAPFALPAVLPVAMPDVLPQLPSAGLAITAITRSPAIRAPPSFR